MAAYVATPLVPPSLVVDAKEDTLQSSGISQINSINDLILHRAETIPETPLIAYPDVVDGRSSWTEYTARDLDVFADEAAKELTNLGLTPKDDSSSKSEVISLLGPSNLNYAVTFIALSRMGFAVLFLSTRLPVEAYVALLEKTECSRMVSTTQFSSVISDITKRRPLETFPIIEKSVYTRQPASVPSDRFQRRTTLVNEESCIAFIIHSSGSTGLPKPIFQTHRACLRNYAVGSGMRAFTSLPLFHNSGISTLFRGIVAGKKTAFHNAALPLTNKNLVDAMLAMDPESFHCVPYTLKLLAETQEGVEALKKCKTVICGGSSCPDDLGDIVVQQGVPLVSHYGQTEMGQLMISKTDDKDKLWNYLRPLPKAKPYLHFEPIGDGQYECVVLDGLPTKVISNSDNPPNSYYTRDCFVPHPTLPDMWKYTGRLDDRLTLVNGEKVLPVPMENRIRQDELVHECLVFGAGRTLPGLLIFPSDKAVGMSKGELLDRLTPAIDAANSNAEKFGQISREMIEILEPGAEYPGTDKKTIIRAKSYQVFADLIDSVYARFEAPSEASGQPQKKLDLEGLKDYLLDLFRNRLGKKDLNIDTDFFASGIDSLQVILARGHMMRELDLSGSIIRPNAVYEYPNIPSLATYLHALSNGVAIQDQGESSLMEDMVKKYGDFEPFHAGTEMPQDDVVLLTGATGSLGAHVLSQLLPLAHVKRVYCLVRATDEMVAMARVLSSLYDRGVIKTVLQEAYFRKVVALPSDLSRPDLGLSTTRLTELQSTLTSVIHSAWAVNFNLGVASFEDQHIRGVRHLLDICLKVPFASPAHLSFISSVSSAAGIPPPAVVPETYVANPEHAQNMGYAKSKWVSEHIIRLAAEQTGINARVLRTGQIIGDSKEGRWNSSEAIPLMIRSATTLGVLPALDETPTWLPVDVCAEAVLELSGVSVPSTGGSATNDQDPLDVVYHVQNPRHLSWTDDLLPALKDAGLEFEVVGQRDWVAQLRSSDADPRRNPTIKLLDFFASKYDNDRPGRKGLAFDTSETERMSPAIARKFDVIEEGTIQKCVAQWMKEWAS
ncbi:acetyl-CoA synthetase-like protein [Xylariaceae sp. FL0016]|nr:acetyl-CoA synthetase-like protein [Xylariaceae sp. FL0016]